MTEAVQPTTVGRSDADYPRPVVAWYATGILAFLYWVSILDRFIISLLVDPIKRDLGITDVQFGLLHGFAFAITFSFFGLLCGTFADRMSRRLVICAGTAVWSLATALCGLAQQFWHLLLARVGVGVGEAALNPSATSMLSDLFPPHRLTSAMAVYAMGATVGSGCAFIFGGMIIDMASQTNVITLPLIGPIRSWQAVFMIVGLPGIALSLLIFTVPEPVRRGMRAAAQTTQSIRKAYAELWKFIGTRQRFFFCHYAAFAFASSVITGLGTWYPAHMARNFGWSSSEIGWSLGITLTISAVLAQVLCGRVVDAMFRRGWRDAQLRFYAGCLLIGTPIGVIATTNTHPWVFLVGIGVFLVFISSLPPCAATALNLVTPNELRGTGMAFYSFASGLVGTAAGPVLVAMFSDRLFGGGASIGFGMATLVAICCPAAAICLGLALRPMREAVAAAEQWSR